MALAKLSGVTSLPMPSGCGHDRVTPVLTIQGFGLAYKIKAQRAEKESMIPVAEDSITCMIKMKDDLPRFTTVLVVAKASPG